MVDGVSAHTHTPVLLSRCSSTAANGCTVLAAAVHAARCSAIVIDLSLLLAFACAASTA